MECVCGWMARHAFRDFMRWSGSLDGFEMIGIKAICIEVPSHRIPTAPYVKAMGLEGIVLQERIGFKSLARKYPGQDTSDLCVAAVKKLLSTELVQAAEVDCVVVVSQTPDEYGIPHTAAIVQRKLELPDACACFDVNLGSSGYIYGLSIVMSCMESNGLKRGLLFTADPYSKIINDYDRDAALHFGDAATVTLLTDQPEWSVGRFDFGTAGALGDALRVRLDTGGKLRMDSRTIQKFCLERTPQSIIRVLELNGLTLDQVDRVILHQASRIVIDEVGKALAIPEKVGFYAEAYGNTGSSSIPIVLAENVASADRRVVLSGFGTGLSWGSTVLNRV